MCVSSDCKSSVKNYMSTSRSPQGFLVHLLVSFLARFLSSVVGAPPPPPVCRLGEMGGGAIHLANLTVAEASSWCRNEYNCAGFSAAVPFSNASCNTGAVVEARFADSWGARRPNRDIKYTNWIVPGPRPPAPRPPYHPPPNPCLPGGEASPRYHIMNLGVGPHDLNSVFLYRGVWHVMHQVARDVQSMSSCHYVSTIQKLYLSVSGELDGLGAPGVHRPRALDAHRVRALPKW